MPIYEYGCDKCGNHLELLQKVGDPPPPRCDKCRKGKMEKMISRTSFQLKGSGWYASDYASSSPGKSESKVDNKSESKADDKSESPKETKTEAKTETKAEKGSSDSKPVPAA